MIDRLVRVEAGPARDAYLPLLLLADDAEQLVHGYYQSGDLFGFEVGAEVVGAVLVTGSGSTRELKSVAVDEQRHGHGIGQRMLRAVTSALRASGVSRLELMTGNSSVG